MRGASPEMIVVLPADDFAEGAAAEIVGALRAVAAGGEGSMSLMLAGGSTPRSVYERLAAVPDLPWDRIAVYFGDERAVPPDRAGNNFRMAREALLDHVPVPPGRVHRMEAERKDREAAARDYAALLPGEIDVLLLGLGTDGHVASLFPGAPQLAERGRRVASSRGPEPPHDRLTVTPPVIRGARRTLILVAGERKAAAVRAALVEEGPIDECPGRLVRDARWILDEAAAAAL